MSGKSTIKEQINKWAGEGIPFLFVFDFELVKPMALRLDEIDPRNLLYSIGGWSNSARSSSMRARQPLVKYPEPYEEYLEKFSKARDEISAGNSYLLNLTCKTPVELEVSLLDIYNASDSLYKIWFDDKFVCFSPETFVTISNGVIRSFPMKGTIDASIPDAANIIINDGKETAEHYTIVDLIRNDLSIVSRQVRVERFRYIETIATSEKKLLQVSSEIAGILDNDWRQKTGDIIFSLLPAGSVSGAPKKKTTEIIAEIEKCARGYYTGVFGIFDGHSLTSSVMIRFIEKTENGFFYRSGGGITSFSDPLSEYNEMIDKIYVPAV